MVTEGMPVLGDNRRRSTLKLTRVISLKKTAAFCRGAHPFTLAGSTESVTGSGVNRH